MKATAPGDLVQLDTLSVTPSGERTVKQFTAYDPVSRFTCAQAFRRATARNAESFLDELNPRIDKFANIYNTFRPHGALKGRTPEAYLQQITAKKISPSHM